MWPLGAEDFQLDGQALSKALGDANGEHAGLPGLRLRVGALPEQHQQRSLAELGELLRDLQQQQLQLKEQLATAQALELVQRERDGFEQQLVQLDAELRDYSQMQALQDSDAERQARLVTLDQKLAELATSLAQSAARYRALDQQRQQRQKDLDSLGQQHRQIEQRRNQRIDREGPFTWLSDSPHHPWLAQPEFALDQLAERLQTFHHRRGATTSARARADRADATPGDGTGAGSGLAARVLVAFVRQFSQVWLCLDGGSRLH